MSSRIVFRGIAVLMVIAMLWTLGACASAPAAEAPVEQPPPTETPPPAPTVQAPEPVAAEAFQAARDAIAEAQAAGAETHAADLLAEAQQALADAEARAPTDPDAARELLKLSIEKAHQAKAAAEKAQRQAALDALDQEAVAAIAEAQAAGAAEAAPDLFNQANQALAEARSQGADAFEAAQGSYRTAIEKAHQARDAALADVEARQRAQAQAAEAARIQALLDGLDQKAQAAIAEAEAAGASQYAPELLLQAQGSLNQAREQRATDADQAQASYEAAIAQALQARDASNEAALRELDQAAQDAIAGAEAAEADTYSPALLAEARQALAQGRAQKDPQIARRLLTLSAEKAHEAKDSSLVARTKALLAKIDQAVEALKTSGGPQWIPDQTGPALERAAVARAEVERDYAVGLPLANEAVKSLDEMTKGLKTRIQAVLAVKEAAQQALDEAEAVEASIWVPDLLQSANDAFFQGTGAWKKFRIDAAEEAWNMALFEARSATAKASAELERKRTEQLMLETMKKLEDASGKTVVDPQDNIIGPQAWDGKSELEKLKKKPVSFLIPLDGSVVVLGEKQRITYLDEAKDHWARGVQALEAGDLPLANEAFLQSQKLIDTYLSMAIDKVYTVRLVPERRDSLWRISGNDEIYSTPWEWPKIWKRNQKLIQNPDLIYPGWQLIIPPQ